MNKPANVLAATAAAAVILAFTTPALAQKMCTSSTCRPQFKTMNEAIDYTLAREKENTWRQIQWRTDDITALADARRENKPIFVFFTVKSFTKGEDGKT